MTRRAAAPTPPAATDVEHLTKACRRQPAPVPFPNGPVKLATSTHEIRQDIPILLIAAIAPARIIDAVWGA